MNILLAEDEKDTLRTYKLALENRNHKVTITDNGEYCLKIYLEKTTTHDGSKKSKTMTTSDHKPKAYMPPPPPPSPFDVVILDYKMPKKDGMQVAKEILDINPKQRIIIASAYVYETLEEVIKKLGLVVEVMQKPFDPQLLIDRIEDKTIYLDIHNLISQVKKVKNPRDPEAEDIKSLFKALKRIEKKHYL